MIRQLIREMLLAEAAWTPERLGKNYQIFVKKLGKSNMLSIELHRIKMNPQYDEVLDKYGVELEPSSESVGFVKIYKPSAGSESGPCDGAYVIYESSVDQEVDGAGPLLYDVAIEMTGEQGLTADRSSVSDDALRVWSYYLNKRTDVNSRQLDDTLGTLTPVDPMDDCWWTATLDDDLTNDLYDSFETKRQDLLRKDPVNFRSSFDKEKEEFYGRNPGYKEKLLSSPLTKAYTKNGTPVIDRLKKLGLIKFDDRIKI